MEGLLFSSSCGNKDDIKASPLHLRAYIQKRGSILAWIVILSVYGADTIAEARLLISPFLRWSLDLYNQLFGFYNVFALWGWYFETRFHIGMDRNFVSLWRRHNCRSQVIDLSPSALISWYMKSIIGFWNNSNLHAIISTLLIFNLHWVLKI